MPEGMRTAVDRLGASLLRLCGSTRLSEGLRVGSPRTGGADGGCKQCCHCLQRSQGMRCGRRWQGWRWQRRAGVSRDVAGYPYGAVGRQRGMRRLSEYSSSGCRVGSEVRGAPGWINADRDARWWGDWVGSDDAEPALSLADAGSGPASGPGRPCSPTVSRDPGIFGLSRPAHCDPGQSAAPGNVQEGKDGGFRTFEAIARVWWQMSRAAPNTVAQRFPAGTPESLGGLGTGSAAPLGEGEEPPHLRGRESVMHRSPQGSKEKKGRLRRLEIRGTATGLGAAGGADVDCVSDSVVRRPTFRAG